MRLYRAFATVGGWTAASRILGFVREMLMAAVVGTGPVADAFIVAFRFPNLFRRLFGEGAFNSAFVPLFASRLEADGPEAARRFAEDAYSGLLVVLIAVSALCMALMPWLMLGMAPGFTGDLEKFDLAVALTRITFPYLLCMSLVALLSGLLNALRRFVAAAAAPVLLNIVLVGVLFAAQGLGYDRQPAAGYVLAWGVSAAGILQLALLLVMARRQGYPMTLRRPRLTEDVRRLVHLGVPGVISGGVTQINIVIGTMIASMQPAAVSFLYYADRLYQLPLGIVGVAVGVVLLPDLARRLRAGDENGAADALNRSVEFALLLTLPAAIALAVVPEPIIRVLFERGAFVAADTRATAQALMAFALGLPSFVLVKAFSPGFFAREDTRTPMRFAIVAVVINVLVSIGLFPLIGHVGVALATTISGWINALMLGWTLHRRGHFVADERLARSVPRLLASSAGMGGALYGLARWLEPLFAPESGFLAQSGALAALVIGGLALFALLCEVSGAARLRQITGGIRRR